MRSQVRILSPGLVGLANHVSFSIAGVPRDANLIIAEGADVMRSEFDERVNALKRARSKQDKS